MMDKSDAEIGAAEIEYPDSEIKLCFFHYMQAWERWMSAHKNNVALQYRMDIKTLLRSLKFSKTPDEYQQNETIFLDWLNAKNLQHVVAYYQDEWKPCKEKFSDAWYAPAGLVRDD
jgi:hypothetical protein